MKKIQVLKIKNLDKHGYLPMLKWLRHYQQEWSLPDCLEWLNALPNTLGPYTQTDAKKIIETLTPLAEISEEVVAPE